MRSRVDDDSLVLANIAAMLEDLGHKVIAVGSGARAIEEIESTPAIDMVITDQAMPVMTGTAADRAFESAAARVAGNPGQRICGIAPGRQRIDWQAVQTLHSTRACQRARGNRCQLICLSSSMSTNPS